MPDTATRGSAGEGDRLMMRSPIVKALRAGTLCFVVPLMALPCMSRSSGGRANSTLQAGSGQTRSQAPAQAADGNSPQLPSKRVDTSIPKITGRTIKVTEADNLQRALDQARPGDQLLLPSGAVFKGNFVLPKKEGAGGKSAWITITTALPNGAAPAAGTRIDPKSAAPLAKIVSPNTEPALKTAPGAGSYRLMLLDFGVAPTVNLSYGVVRFGEGSETSLDQLPHDLIVDRCFIHGLPDMNIARGIALNSANTAVIDSYISDIHETGFDSQAICGWNGPGPFEISNNYVEASGENILIGGADAQIQGLIPSDIVIRKNYCTKPVEWRTAGHEGKPWGVKNLLELKNADRVLIEDNVFENNWVQAQTGYAILFKSVDQGGRAPWSVTRNVTFRNNVVRHTSSAVSIQGRDPHVASGRTASIAIENNMFEDVDGKKWGGEGAFLKITDAEKVTVDHNTVSNTGSIIVVYGPPCVGFAFTNNLVRNNAYGIKGDGTASGMQTLRKYFPESVVAGNAIAGGASSAYPPGNCFPGAAAVAEGMKNPAASGACRGTDGKPAGCNLNLHDLTAAVIPGLEKQEDKH